MGNPGKRISDRFPKERFSAETGMEQDFVSAIVNSPFLFTPPELEYYEAQEREQGYYYNYLANNSALRDGPFVVICGDVSQYLKPFLESCFYLIVTPSDPLNVAKRIKAKAIIFCEPTEQIPSHCFTHNTVALGGVPQGLFPQISLGSPTKNVRLLREYLRKGVFPRVQVSTGELP